MNPKLHIADDDLALYAAGALSAEERATAETHLRVCARCTEEVRQNTLALAAYAQTTPEAAPPQGAKDRFMARVAATKQGETSVPVQPVQAAEPKVGFLRQVLLGEGRWTPALAGALLISKTPGAGDSALPEAGTNLPLYGVLGMILLAMGAALTFWRRPVRS